MVNITATTKTSAGRPQFIHTASVVSAGEVSADRRSLVDTDSGELLSFCRVGV